jgi:hypothetical protein
MDEDEYDFYMDQVWGDVNPFGDEEDADLVSQLWDEDGSIEGCYRVLPAPSE